MSRIDPYSTVNVLRIVKSLCSIFIRMRTKRSAYAMAVVMRNVTLLPVSSRIQSTAYQIVWIAITCQLGCVTHTLSIRRCEHAVPFTNTCKWWDCDIFGGNWRMGQTLYIYASWFSYAKLHLCTAPNQILFIRFQPNFIPRFLYIHLTHILFLNSNCFLSMKSSIQAMARNPSQ